MKKRMSLIEDFDPITTHHVGPWDIYMPKDNHCIYPRWYCRFLFWMKHGEWYQKRVFMSLEDLLK